MTQNINFQSASSEVIIAALGQRLDEIRLSRNISQAHLAEQAGVSRSTLTRLADGKPVSLDSFVRVIQALQLTDQLAALLPQPSIRPVDRVRLDGTFPVVRLFSRQHMNFPNGLQKVLWVDAAGFQNQSKYVSWCNC